mgnify:CR=1 FL=1
MDDTNTQKPNQPQVPTAGGPTDVPAAPAMPTTDEPTAPTPTTPVEPNPTVPTPTEPGTGGGGDTTGEEGGTVPPKPTGQPV